MIASILVAAAVTVPQVSLPTYRLNDGEKWNFVVKAKAEIQPYGIGGPITLSFKQKTGGKWDVMMNHKTEFEMNGEKGPGNEMAALFEMDGTLTGTGSGQGMLLFGEQLNMILALPASERTTWAWITGNEPVITKATKDQTMIKVTSEAKNPTGQHTIERWLDEKTLKLVRAKAVTKNATGLITYELLPAKK